MKSMEILTRINCEELLNLRQRFETTPTGSRTSRNPQKNPIKNPLKNPPAPPSDLHREETIEERQSASELKPERNE